MQTAGRRSVLVAIAPLAVVAAVAGCGGSSGGSSKPQYCADRSKLEQSLKDVASTKVLEQGGIQDLKKRLQTVESDAHTLVGSAKGDFPKETGAIQSSVSTLKASAQKLGSSPSPQQVGTLAKDAKAVVTSFQSFKKASDSKC